MLLLPFQGTPFREAYRQVAESLAELKENDVKKSLFERVSPCACARLGLDFLQIRLDALKFNRS